MDDTELVYYLIETIASNTGNIDLQEAIYNSLITGLNKYGFKAWNEVLGADPIFEQVLEERLKK